MTNSLGLVLTLVTLSSNCLKLTTSLLEGYINGQVKVVVKKGRFVLHQVGISLVLVLMGYLGLLAFLILTERLTRCSLKKIFKAPLIDSSTNTSPPRTQFDL